MLRDDVNSNPWPAKQRLRARILTDYLNFDLPLQEINFVFIALTIQSGEDDFSPPSDFKS